jgi:release factor glutamine methyltransferase
MTCDITGRTIGQVLSEGREVLAKTATSTPALDAEMILSKTLNMTRTQLYINNARMVGDEERRLYTVLLQKRCEGMPIAHITRSREFMSLTFTVDARCLIPRAETEILVESVLKKMESNGLRGPSILEIGTGSGCIAVALARYLPESAIVATDISPEALEIAHENANKNMVSERITFLAGDLYEALKQNWSGLFDAILSNPPYVAENEVEYLPRSVRNYEPACALWTGEGGLSVTRRIIEGASRYLAPSGFIALEINPRAKHRAGKLMRGSGFEVIEIINDLSGLPRVVLAERQK